MILSCEKVGFSSRNRACGSRKSTGIEIVELIGVGFSRHVPDVAFVPAILSAVFPKSGRSPDRGPGLATPDRCASTTDSQAEIEIRR